MNKKLWKQKIVAILVCALMICITGTNTAFASASGKNITADSKANNNEIKEDGIRESISEEESTPKLKEILEESNEVKPDVFSTEISKGEIISIESVSGDMTKMTIMSNGDLYCWGNNTYGQVGNGKTAYQTKPEKVLNDVKSVSYFNSSVSAITTNGDLYCWGDNIYGQVGNGTTDKQTTPVKVLSDVKSVSYFDDSVSAITTNGDLYCWGNNTYGQVGNGTTDKQTTPVKVLSDIKSVSYFDDSVSAITTNGDLYCWGNNTYGQVGNGTTTDQTTPIKVLSDVKSVSYFDDSVSAITANGDLYCWGDNYCGQIGNNGTTDEQTTPVKVLSDVKFISSSDSSRLAVTTNRDLYCWGDNKYGQVGNGTTDKQTTPLKVLSDIRSASYCASYSVSAITANGDLYCWGDNYCGQIGNGTTDNQITPVKVLSDVKSISSSASDSGYSHYSSVSAIMENGDLYCWGYNEYGQAGNGTTITQTTPIKVLTDVKSVSYAHGSYISMSAIMENGDLYCWGCNEYGQVGNDTTNNQTAPVKVLSDVKFVFYHNDSSVSAIMENGDLYCWGVNYSGEVGNGTIAVNDITGHQLTPYKVLFDNSSNNIISEGARHVTGTLNEVNINNSTVVIGDTEYGITDGFDISVAYDILSGSRCKTVTAILSDNKVLKMNSVEDIVEPKVNISFDPHSISYQGGTFDSTQVKIKVSLSCGAKSPYRDSDIKGTEAESVSFNFSEYTVRIPGDLEFKGTLSSSPVVTDEISDTLKLGIIKDYVEVAYIKKDYIPKKVKDALSVIVTAVTTTGNGQEVIYNAAELPVANLDKQSETAENKNISEDITEAETLMDKITFAMNGDNYYSKEQLNAIESVVKAWIAEMFVTQILTTDTEDNSIWIELCKEAGFSSSERNKFLTNIATKAFKKLGLDIASIIDSGTGLHWKNTETETVIRVYQEDGKKYDKVTVNLQFGNLSFSENNTFTGFGKLNYTIQTPDKKRYTSIGNVAFTDLQTFSECVQSICTKNIKQIFNIDIHNNLDKGAEWIRKQINNVTENKIVEALTSDIASKLLSKKFGKVSDNVFEIYTKKIIKKTNGSVHCPVDVYIYDSHGTLCGSIVNNQVETDNGDIFLYCTGEEKYFSLTGDDYKIQFIGNDKGSMTYKIDEYCNLELIRSIIYENVKLQKNKTYQEMIPQTQLLDTTIYNLISMDDAEMIIPSSDIRMDNKTDINNSSNSSSGAGSISGGGISIVFVPTPTPIPTAIVTPSPVVTLAPTPTAVITPVPTPTPVITPVPTATPVTITTDKPVSVVTPEPSASANSETGSDNNSKRKIISSDITLNKKTFIYNGKAKKPRVTVINDLSELIKDSDYTVSYYNNTNVGTATVTINGIGNYIGSINKTFKIVPKGIPIKGKLKPEYKGFTVKWKKQPSSITGYQVQYSTSKKFNGKTTVIKTVKKKFVTKFKTGKLKLKKRYYARVRTYKTVQGRKYYSKWSKAKTVIIKK